MPISTELISKLGRGAASTFDLGSAAKLIRRGQDPLGDFFCSSVSPDERRAQGATFTPDWLVQMMLDHVAAKGLPSRVVDAGAGTGRFAIAAARRWPKAVVVAIEKDPSLAEAIKTNSRLSGVHVHVICADYTQVVLEPHSGVTAFIGNPPYVRHHDIPDSTKSWFKQQMKSLDLPCSLLTGLHVYFFLQSFRLAQPGDVGCFVTSAEWTETGYGLGMRSLFCKMGGDDVVRFDPTVPVFADALTTSIVAGWKVGYDGTVRFSDLRNRRVVKSFEASHPELELMSKWPGFGEVPGIATEGGALLGDFFRISRGQVSGMNDIWIANDETESLIPDRYLFPCITDAAEVIRSGGVLRNASKLRRVIDLPRELYDLTRAERKRVDLFLTLAESRGAAATYIAKHRKPWWRVGLKAPPAIVMTYMGRRPPVFARNLCQARLLNVAHGMTPVTALDVPTLDRFVTWLNANVATSAGRTYGGGLVKFEPGEAMRIPIPQPSSLFAA